MLRDEAGGKPRGQQAGTDEHPPHLQHPHAAPPPSQAGGAAGNLAYTARRPQLQSCFAAAAQPVIDDVLFEKINSRCDVVLSSASAAAVPSLCWGMAGRLLADRRTVEAWVRDDHGRQFLADVRSTQRAAAVFNEPYTNIAVQLKGRDAGVRPATADDQAFLRLHVGHMVRELHRVHFDEPFARAFFEQPWSLLAVVRFTADQVFAQTPGPRAGQALVAPEGSRRAG